MRETGNTNLYEESFALWSIEDQRELLAELEEHKL